jgi:hypothetical protein
MDITASPFAPFRVGRETSPERRSFCPGRRGRCAGALASAHVPDRYHPYARAIQKPLAFFFTKNAKGLSSSSAAYSGFFYIKGVKHFQLLSDS